MFALSNGHIGLRGNLDEGEPYGLPGTYLGGFYETRPLPYAEAGYGYPEDGQSVVNVTNGKIMRLLVEDEPFDVRYGVLRSHERVLDLRAGVLRRPAHWVSPTGREIKVSSTRLVSFTQRAVAAIEYVVEPVEDEFPVVVQSELVANEPMPTDEQGSARRGRARRAAGLRELRLPSGLRAILVHHTRASGLRMAAAMEHLVEGPDGTECGLRGVPGPGAGAGRPPTWRPASRCGSSSCSPTAGRPSARRRRCATRSAPARRGAIHTGWDGLLAEQREYLDDFWERADVEIEGDAELQQAIRFGLFHTLQAGARGEQRAIAAKGLTGPGYDGHTFWDTEMFVLPVLTYTAPHACADALRWRHGTLDLARERAHQLGLEGAAFPWRTIRGQECSSYWPAGRRRFTSTPTSPTPSCATSRSATTTSSSRRSALELLVETARLWRSLGHHDASGAFRIDGVTGPDEYSGRRRQQRLHQPDGPAQSARRGRRRASATPTRARELEVDAEEAASWRDAADKMVVLYDEALGVHPQAEGFTRHQLWDFERLRAGPVPAAAALPLLRPVPQAGRQAGRPRAGAVPCAGTRSPPRRRRATSTTTSR